MFIAIANTTRGGLGGTGVTVAKSDPKSEGGREGRTSLTDSEQECERMINETHE